MNHGPSGPSKGGGRIRTRALPLLAIGVVFAVVGAVLLATGSRGAGPIILLILGLGDAVVAGGLLVVDATYGRRLRR